MMFFIHDTDSGRQLITAVKVCLTKGNGVSAL